MIVIPAIDLMDGQVVRLRQGNYDDKTVFPGAPEDYVTRWQDDGVRRIHIVDLEGARTGQVKEWETLRRMAKKAKVPLELGGGLRKMEDLEKAVDLGFQHLVLGTAALENERLLQAAVNRFGSRIVVGADCRDGKVHTKGWLEDSDIDLIPFCQELEGLGVSEVIYTNIAVDGMKKGPDVDGLEWILHETELSVVLSGGVSGMDDIKTLAKVKDPRFRGVICGRALYDGEIDLKEAAKVIREFKK